MASPGKRRRKKIGAPAKVKADPIVIPAAKPKRKWFQKKAPQPEHAGSTPPTPKPALDNEN